MVKEKNEDVNLSSNSSTRVEVCSRSSTSNDTTGGVTEPASSGQRDGDGCCNQSKQQLSQKRPSWISETHPLFVLGNDAKCKKMRDDLIREAAESEKKKKARRKKVVNRTHAATATAAVATVGDGDKPRKHHITAAEEIALYSKPLKEHEVDDDDDDDDEGIGVGEEDEDDDEDEDEEVDEEDMVYGLDPGFTDIDEELRVIEGMINEHTVFKEVEVLDGEDSDSENEMDSRIDAALKNLRSRSNENLQAMEAAAAIPPSSPEAEEDKPGVKKPKSKEMFAAVPVVAQGSVSGVTSSKYPIAAPVNDTALIKTGGLAGVISMCSDSISKNSQTEQEEPKESTTDQAAENPTCLPLQVTIPNSTSVQTQALVAPADKKNKRVRLVELPDYLAMVAREHQRLLLEKRKRDLQLAAQAANARDPMRAAAKGPRSQSMIRRGYFDRLGIAGDSAPISPKSSVNAARRLDMGINARRAAIASARTRRRPPSMRVRLRAPVTSSKSGGFFKKITSWMNSDYNASDSDSGTSPRDDYNRPSSYSDVVARSLQSATSVSSRSQGGGLGPLHARAIMEQGRHVNFQDTADVFFIPARSDYPTKIKHSIWHTRAEFVDMVVKNMDQLELEIQQETDARRRLQDLKNNPPPSSISGRERERRSSRSTSPGTVPMI